MHWRGLLIAGLTLLGSGCASEGQDRLRAYREDGVYLFKQGDYPAAKQCFQAALTLRPEDPNLSYNLGECYDRQGNTARAEALYAECLQRAPNHADCRHALALLQYRTGRQKEAVTMVADWLAKEPNLAAAFAEDGWMSREEGDLPRALNRYQQALEHDPHNSRALLGLALLYEAMDRPERSVALYERLLELEPGRGDVAQRYTVLVKQGAKRPQPD